MNKQEKDIKKALEIELPEWNDNMVWDKIEEELHPAKDRKFFICILFGGTICFSALLINLFMKSAPIQDTQEDISSFSSSKANIEKRPSNRQTKNTIASQQLPSFQLQATQSSLSTTTQTNHVAKKVIAQNSQTITAPSTFEFATAFSAQHTIQQKNNSAVISSSSKPSVGKTIIPNPPARNLINNLSPLSSKVNLLTSLAKQEQDLNIISIDNFDLTSTITPVTKSVSSPYQLLFKSGLYHTTRNLAGTKSSWADEKNRIDVPLESYDLSISLRRTLTSRFSFSAGLAYNQTVELLTSNDSKVTTRLVPADTATIITHNLGNQYLAGEVLETTSQTSTTKTPNRFRSITVPFSLYYRMHRGSWGMELSGGADINLKTWFQGKILNYDQSVIRYNTEDQNYYNLNTGIANVNLEAAVSYSTSDRLSFSLGLKYKHGLHDYLSSENYDLKYNLIGLNFSTLYRF